MKQALLGFLVLLLCATPSATTAQQAADFTYTTNGNSITITEYTGTDDAVVIPGWINGLPVASVASVETNATFGTSIIVVMIPDSVTNIAFGAFSNCLNLLAITVDAYNQYYSDLDGVLFDKSQSTLIQYPQGNLPRSYTVPNSVISIGDSAFSACSITGVIIPDSVICIGTNAFYGCYDLVDLTLGTSITTIGNGAFSGERWDWDGGFGGGWSPLGCPLSNVTIPNSVTNIGDYAFYCCTFLTNLTLGQSVATIGDFAFAGCALTNVTIPDSLTSIGLQALAGVPINVVSNSQRFSSADGVLFDKNQTMLILYPSTSTADSYTIPDNVISIGSNAFYNCYSLTSLTIGKNVTDIGNNAFYGLVNLSEASIPHGVTNIGAWAFSGCALTNVAIPDSVISIGEHCFSGCGVLSNVTIGSGIVNIGDQAFSCIGGQPDYGCSSLRAINVNTNNAQYSSVNGILFDKRETTLIQYPEGRSGSYTVPNGVTRIGDYAFASCSGLTNLMISGSVASIGGEALYCCSDLGGVLFEGNPPLIDGDGSMNGALFSPAFYFIPTLYYLPSATGWSSSLAGCPALLWNPTLEAIGVQSSQFGFDITGTANIPILVEGSTTLAAGSWVPLQTGILTNGVFRFSDPSWIGFPTRLYRLAFSSATPPQRICYCNNE